MGFNWLEPAREALAMGDRAGWHVCITPTTAAVRAGEMVT